MNWRNSSLEEKEGIMTTSFFQTNDAISWFFIKKSIIWTVFLVSEYIRTCVIVFIYLIRINLGTLYNILLDSKGSKYQLSILK